MQHATVYLLPLYFTLPVIGWKCVQVSSVADEPPLSTPCCQVPAPVRRGAPTPLMPPCGPLPPLPPPPCVSPLRPPRVSPLPSPRASR